MPHARVKITRFFIADVNFWGKWRAIRAFTRYMTVTTLRGVLFVARLRVYRNQFGSAHSGCPTRPSEEPRQDLGRRFRCWRRHQAWKHRGENVADALGEDELTSSGRSRRSFWLPRGTMTRLIPARRAASVFSLRPPMGRTRPVKVTSPVMAVRRWGRGNRRRSLLGPQC